ncbi:hypothetical protein Tco_0702948 [Tanacetum coccineum]|uniref:Uncharacterized protein n=1 Tax=Tanacetum coccineum TaxID=301880 RepID=A0ABQ4XZA9_9ASTR
MGLRGREDQVGGWLRGLSLGLKEEEIPAVRTNTNNLNIEDTLMKVSPDVPPPAMEDQAGPSVENDGNSLAKADSPKARPTETLAEASPKTAV